MKSDAALVIRHLPFATLITDTSSKFCIIEASNVYLKATFTDRDDIVGKGLFEVFPAEPSHAGGRANLQHSLQMVLDTKKPHAMNVQRYDVHNAQRTGFVVKYWLPTNFPVIDDSGEVRFIIHRVYDQTELMTECAEGIAPRVAMDAIHATDISAVVELLHEGERRRQSAEESAIEAGERLELAIAAADLGTFYCPMPLNTIYWNDKCKEHFFLPKEAEVDLALFYDRIHPGDLERTRAAIDAAVEGRSVYDVEYRVVAPDGRQRWLRAKGRSYVNEAGEATRFDGITIDITKNKKIEEELARSNQRKDEFLAMLAHELRNPLAPVRAAADLLAMSQDTRNISKVSAVVSRQVKHMEALLADLLDVSRVTRGLVEIDKNRVDCKHVIATALEQVSPLIESKQHRVQLNIQPTAAFVLGDEKRLVQAVANLLVNAAKYTDVGGKIDIGLEVNPSVVRISITDNGMGISSELLPHVYELFVQGDRTPDRAHGGLGLGLALVKSLVDLHSGQIDVTSKGEGFGTTFVIALPRLTSGAPHVPARPSQQVAKAGAAMQIVIVDDNVDAAWTLAACLNSLGHRAMELSDPFAALALSVEDIPDVFILDIGMPGMDGHELARRLRGQEASAGKTLIAVTGYAAPIGSTNGRSLFDHYLVKPIKLPELVNLLDTLGAT